MPTEKPSLKKLLWAGPLTIVIAVVINLILRFIAVAVLQPAANFLPLSAQGPVVPFTIVGTLGAVIVFALVARFAPNPIRAYRIISVVALVVSFIPDILLLLAPQPGVAPSVGAYPAPGLPVGAYPVGNVPSGDGPAMMMGGVTLPNVLALMLMHTASWAVCFYLLPRLTQTTKPN